MSAQARTSRLRLGLVLLATVPFVYPFLFLIATALKPIPEFSVNSVGLPEQPTLDNLKTAWTTISLSSATLHSVVAVGVAVIVTLAISAVGAFWFLRHTGPIAKILRVLLIGTMAVPPPVFVMPLFVQFTDWGITDNLIALGLVYAGWNASFGLFLLHAYFGSLPRDVLEAAEVDGAGPRVLLTQVLLPLSRPALATLGMLTFVWSWGDLLLSLVLVQDPSLRTLTPSTALLADQFSAKIPEMAAGVFLAILPVLAVFLIGQRFLVRGILAGIGK